MKKTLKKLLICCMLALGICVLPYCMVSAAQKAPGMCNLKVNTLYKNYDFTGDGKPDTFSVTASGATSGSDSYYKEASVRINGRRVYQLKNSRFYGMKISLITLQNGKPFVYLQAVTDNDHSVMCGLFQYEAGKLKKVIDFAASLKKFGSSSSGEVVRISGNRITARFYVMSWSLGPVYLEYTYTYTNGTLKQVNAYGTLKSRLASGKNGMELIAGKRLNAFKTPGKTTKAFVLKKGNKVTTTGKCWVYKGTFYFQVKYKNKAGWIKSVMKPAASVEKQQFSNVQYVG